MFFVLSFNKPPSELHSLTMAVMKTKTPTPPFEAKLSSGVNVDFKPVVANTPRKFSGTANSGLPFLYWGETTVVDFENIKFKPQTAILYEHEKPAGVGVLQVSTEGLLATGNLLSSEYGQRIAADSDEGFPWEMSVYVIAGRHEELQAGIKATVNGHEITGPLVIWRDCTVREVSFTAVGVDPNTNATALSGLLPQSQTEHETMTPEEKAEFDALKAEVQTLKQDKADLEAANKTLEAEKAEAEAVAKEAEVDAQLSDAGFKRGEDGKGFQGVSAVTYRALLSASLNDAKAMIADLQPGNRKAPAPPSLLSDTQPPSASNGGEQLSGLAASAAARNQTNGANYV